MTGNTARADAGTLTLPDTFEGERLNIRTGSRSGATIIIAIHSTRLGPAIGGCRLTRYPSFAHGLADASRLSKAMSYKCAFGDVPSGGGKTVVIAPPAYDRRDVLLDVGDAVEELGGIYSTGADVGTTSADMIIVSERTAHVLGRPAAHGGSGTPAEPTSRGVLAAMRAVAKHEFGTESLADRHVVISGLGSVGGRMAQDLAAQGVRLTLSDIDSSKSTIAPDLGAQWVEPEQALTTPADIVAPAGIGGILDQAVATTLRCRAIVGPANNQLTDPIVADLLEDRGILWAPDFLVNAGGAIYTAGVEIEQLSPAAAAAKVDAIAAMLTHVLNTAAQESMTPLAAAVRIAENRLAPHDTTTAS